MCEPAAVDWCPFVENVMNVTWAPHEPEKDLKQENGEVDQEALLRGWCESVRIAVRACVGQPARRINPVEDFMRLARICAMGALVGLLIVNPAFGADSARTPQEQAMVEQLRSAYKKQGLPLSPELEEAMVQRMRKMQGDVINANVLSQSVPDASPAQRLALTVGTLRQDGVLPPSEAPAQAAPVTAAPVAPAAATQPPAQLQAAIAERRAQGAATVFEPRSDGFFADGKPVIDSTGRIVMFGGDSATGDVTYFVRVQADQLAVRFANVHSTLPPVTVGSIAVDDDTMRFTSADGQAVAGDDVIPTGGGVVVSRDSAVFAYRYGEALATQPLPDGYRLAPLQRGDISGTGYVLLRRDVPAEEKQDKLKSLVGAFKVMTGKEDDKDYALFNVATGNAVYLNVAEDGENVTVGVGCRKKSAFVNKCESSRSYAALFDADGFPNVSHYYWRVLWMPTAQGPTAVVMERGVRDLNVIRLDSGQKAKAFSRAMGIQRFNVAPLDNGSFKLTADWAFKSHEVADVNDLFEAGASVNGTPAEAPAEGDDAS